MKSQFDVAKVIDREFTGKGCFVQFTVDKNLCQPLEGDLSDCILDCPKIIKKFQIEGEAFVMLYIRKGYIDCFEIWTIEAEYPTSEHPLEFELKEDSPFIRG